MRFSVLVLLCATCGAAAQATARSGETSALPDSPGFLAYPPSQAALPQSGVSHLQKGAGAISGRVVDTTGALVPGARVTLSDALAGDPRDVTADAAAEFLFDGLPEGDYEVTATSEGMGVSAPQKVVLGAGESLSLPEIALPFLNSKADVTVTTSIDDLAREEVHDAIQQRGFGILPNFYTVYVPHPSPLTPGLKFKLAFHASTDAATFGSAAFIALIDQASDTPAYREGFKGYGERFGAIYANAASDIFLGGAVYPTLFHQDPRYYYQGTGGRKSRLLHALSSAIITHGDHGQREFNFSSIAGDLSAGSLANLYYPKQDRGVGLTLGNAAISTGGRMVNTLAAEFLYHRPKKD